MSDSTPDLASILRILASTTHRVPSSQPLPLGDNSEYDPSSSQLPAGPFPTGQVPSSSFYQSTSTPGPPGENKFKQHSSPERHLPKQPQVDPRTIVEWSRALRYVSRVITLDESIAKRIRKLIGTQHDHERQWRKGRESLLELQANREEGRNKVNDVLRGLGGLVDTNANSRKPEEEEAEIRRYDNKVYLACTDMQKAMVDDLKSMGIPFFCTRTDLVCDDGVENRASNGKEPAPQPKGTLNAADLKMLQKRMITLLEDLCRD